MKLNCALQYDIPKDDCGERKTKPADDMWSKREEIKWLRKRTFKTCKEQARLDKKLEEKEKENEEVRSQMAWLEDAYYTLKTEKEEAENHLLEAHEKIYLYSNHPETTIKYFITNL